MSLASTVKVTRHNLRTKDRHITVVASGNYVTGGDTLDLSNVANPNFKPDARFGQISGIDDVEVVRAPAGYGAEIVLGTTLQNCKLKVYSAPGTELTAAAYPAAITAGSFELRFSGPKALL